MSIYKDLNRRPTRRDLLELGVVFLAGTGVLGALSWFWLDRPGAALGLWAAGGVVFALSLVPKVGRLLYVAWMGLGLTLGLVTSPIVLLAVYLIAMVPAGIVFKLIRRDAMRRRIDPAATSYWEAYPKTNGPESYIRQF
jgi:hypothetical protein